MFGGRLKTWMENHIGRPRKKLQPEKEKGEPNGGRTLILESSESLAQSDTGISSGSQQVLSSSGTENKEGYCTTTMESERSGASHRHTAVSLPSPESAYSTGYSTDGASPGGTGPPEYYINIRTGKHYFPSPAPTPTSPHPSGAFSTLHSMSQCLAPEDSSLVPSSLLQPSATGTDRSRLSSRPFADELSPPLGTFALDQSSKDKKQNTLSTSVPSHFEIFSFSKSPCKKSSPKSQLSSLKLFLKSPRQEKGKEKSKGDVNKTPTFENKKKVVSPTRTRRWFKQPFQKLGHRRTDSCEETEQKSEAKKDLNLEKNFCYVLAKENAASPRQRNRIKTNPWLPTEPLSSQNFPILQAGFSPCLMRNRSCTNTPLQNRKTNETETLQNRIMQLNMKYEESKDYLNKFEKVVSRHMGQKLLMELSDHSEEDLTLNEMMGTYNESYVYEKETDILSDSDPTDCEDYGTDSEADNGGDERDSHDDELDFIDNGSVTESDDNFPGNTGKCTYHEVYAKKNSFLYGSDRHHSRKDSESRKSFRRDQDSKGRKEKRRAMRKSFRGEEEDARKRKQRAEVNENVGGLNLSRVFMERMMTRNGSKSADGTPVSMRSQKLVKELRETHIGSDKSKADSRRSNHPEPFLVDLEADKKYNELILEAKNIFEKMQNSPVIQNRKKMNILEDDDRKPYKTDKDMKSVDIWKKAETLCCPQYALKEPEVRKNPKNLGLKLSAETPKKLKRLDFETDKKSSFKAKSSAHSPLDPLGPTFRNFSVFKPVDGGREKVLRSSSEDSEPPRPPERKPHHPDHRPLPVLGSPVVPIAFQSLDLGKPLTSYCPQSEPVKRKIYSCSKTYDKLVKQFENKPTVFDGNARGRTRNGSPRAARGPRSEAPRTRGYSSRERRRDSDRFPEGRPLSSPGPKRSSLPGDPGSLLAPQRRPLEPFR